MITVALLLVALALGWFMLTRWRTGTLTPVERWYLMLSPLPVLLGIGVSVMLTLLRVREDTARRWISPAGAAGLWLSAALLLAGLVLVWRRWVRGESPEGRLGAGVFLAGIPAFLTLIVVLFYAVRS